LIESTVNSIRRFMLPKFLNNLATRYERHRKWAIIAFVLSVIGMLATSAMASETSFVLVFAQIIFIGIFAESFFLIALLYGFRQLHSEQAISPYWRIGFTIGEWVNALIVSLMLPLPLIGIPAGIIWFILEKS
jgi:hypothetical protein